MKKSIFFFGEDTPGPSPNLNIKNKTKKQKVNEPEGQSCEKPFDIEHATSEANKSNQKINVSAPLGLSQCQKRSK